VSLASDDSQMKPLIHSISSWTDGFDDYYFYTDDCHKEQEWRLSLILIVNVKDHPSQE
jgi:hypothetical protein